MNIETSNLIIEVPVYGRQTLSRHVTSFKFLVPLNISGKA